MSSDILNEQVDLDVDLKNVNVSYESTIDSAYHNYSAVPLTVLPGHVAATNVIASSYSSTSVQFRLNTDGMNLINRDPILSFRDIQFTIKRNAMSEALFRPNPSKMDIYEVRNFLADTVGLRWRELGFINLMSSIKVSLNGQAFTFDNIARTMKNEFWFVDRSNLPEVPCTKKDYATSVELDTFDEGSAGSSDNTYSLYDNAKGHRLTHERYTGSRIPGHFDDGETCEFNNFRIISVGNDEFTVAVDFTCPLPQRLFSNFVDSQSFSGIRDIDVQINFDPDMNKALMKGSCEVSSASKALGGNPGMNPDEDYYGDKTVFTWFNCRASNFTLGSPPELSFAIVEPSMIEQTKRKALIEAGGVEPPSVLTYSQIHCNFNTSMKASASMQTHSDNFNVDSIPESLTFYAKFNPEVSSTVNADGVQIMPNTFHSHATIPDYYNCIDRMNIRIGNREYVFNHKELYRLSVRAGMTFSYKDFCLGAPIRIRLEDLGYGVNAGNHFVSQQVNNFNISYTVFFYTRYSTHYAGKRNQKSAYGGLIGYTNENKLVLAEYRTWGDLGNGVPTYEIGHQSNLPDNERIVNVYSTGGAVPLIVGCDAARTVYVKTIPEKGEVSQYTSLRGLVDEDKDLETKIALKFMPRPMVLMGGAWYNTVGNFLKKAAKKIVTPDNFASIAKFLQENLLASGAIGNGGRAMMAHNVIGGNRSRVLGGKALPKGFM